VTAFAGSRGRPSLTRAAAWRGLDWNHPEWWVAPLVGLAWVVVVTAAAAKVIAGASAVGRPVSTLFVCPIVAGATAGGGAAWLTDLVGRTVMAIATMAWLLVPTLHHVGRTGLWARRRRGPALVLAAYVAVWVIVVTGLDLVVGTVASVTGPAIAATLAVGVAATWQAAPRRWRAIGRCARTVPLASRGWRADRDCLRFGVMIGRTCVVSCSGYMLLATAAGHSLLAMVVFAVVPLRERVVRPRRPAIGLLAIRLPKLQHDRGR